MSAALPVLPLESCTLRPWKKSDVAALVLHANDRDVWRNLRDRFPHPYRDSDARDWIRQAAASERSVNLAIERDGEAIGGIGLERGIDVHRRTAEIGYWIARPYWGRGIATEAVVGMTAYAFESHDLARLQAFVYEWNPASARVLEKAGYRLEGRLEKSVTKDGRTIDSLLYARVRHD